MSEVGLPRAAMAGGFSEENYTFALDIGTRSIIGLVGVQEEELFRVVASEIKEHPVRAMADGQIEDIRQVARTAQAVKQRLEERVGFPLRHVNVAAAGRALRTGRATFELDVNTGEGITEQQIHELEMGAVSLVREKLDADGGDGQRFYCVGHTAVRYYLDDYPFSTILGHKGAAARVDVIATFLPAEVVDSLCAAMAIIGCEIRNLTLEPIAAMNAVIPSELRLLNLALVDIGAGTSDIAICDGGCVSGYTMATVAGDEVTEEIIKKYLVDFGTAEQMKHAAARAQRQIAYNDILGFEYVVPLEDVLDTIRPATEHLSREICERIEQTNARSPAAVFLVGGGSLTPMLCELVADGLSLDRKKVAIGGNNFIKRVACSEENLSGPEYATPIGIALTAAASGPQSGFHVFINDQKVRLFRNDVMSVLDTLLLCGYQYSELLGRNGRNITYYLDGQKMILRGEHLRPAAIRVNGMDANVSVQIHSGDQIEFTPAESGTDAHLTLRDIGKEPAAFRVSIDGVWINAGTVVMINDQLAKPGQEISDLDRVDTMQIVTLADACAFLEISTQGKVFSRKGVQRSLEDLLQPEDEIISISLTERAVPEQSSPPSDISFVPTAEQASFISENKTHSGFTLKEEQMKPFTELPEQQPAVPVATKEQVTDYPVQSMQSHLATAPDTPSADARSAREKIRTTSTEQTAPSAAPQTPSRPLYPEPAAEPEPRRPVFGRAGIQVTLNDTPVTLPLKEDRMPYQFIDMLNLVELDPTRPQGNIVLLLNGNIASYLDEVHNGDYVEIRWENE